MYDETKYLGLVGEILDNGQWVEGRNGRTLVSIGHFMTFSLEGGTLPFMTTKKLAWKTCLRELLWFISGSTSNHDLVKQGVKIWNANASREALDARGLVDRDVGDLGPVYGHQWRHFDAVYDRCDTDYTGKGVDQLQHVVDKLLDPVERYSRRLVISAWNPNQLEEMALPPCHLLMQFNVVGEDLYCDMYQRSGDVGLGVPFNIASYSMLTHLLAHHCGLKAKRLNYHLSNAHIYEDHVVALRHQTCRDPLPPPVISFGEKKKSIDEYVESDFVVSGYSHLSAIPMEMSV